MASRALRRLLLRGKGSGLDAAQARSFAEVLWTGCLSGSCKQFVDGHAAKVSALEPPLQPASSISFECPGTSKRRCLARPVCPWSL